MSFLGPTRKVDRAASAAKVELEMMAMASFMVSCFVIDCLGFQFCEMFLRRSQKGYAYLRKSPTVWTVYNRDG